MARPDRVHTSAISPTRFVASAVDLKVGEAYVVMPFAFVEGTQYEYSLSVYLHKPGSGGGVALSQDSLEVVPPAA